ncbi:SDR family NAD(P)-dependent oxidoreductase [Bordetella petrii]|uniref:SDR family NAD(P)-dependent oxidoreductase n=1 Tax=Bordetella petrii TaxID=94624 RepID=UPI001A95BFBD|nr:SDR family oxidoreductase [Bordetella petrii]MBO1110616.1 SDR family oxidoreductase [Bordetella petrii]
MFELTGQVALVTGSSRGIGYEAAKALSRQGATVVLNGRDAAGLQAAADALRQDGGDVHTAVFDVADVDVARAAVDALLQSLGSIDIFFANAGVQHREPLASYALADFERIVFTNLTAQWALGRHLAAAMASRGHGRIIFTGSITALQGRRDITAYTAAKAALHGIVRQWAAELADSGVTVNAVAPGYIRTELTQALWEDEQFNSWLKDRVPQKRWGSPQDVAAAVVYLAARESGFVTGQVLAVDGGTTAVL